MNKVIDLSHTLGNNTPVFPGDCLPSFEIDENLKKLNIQVTNIKFNTHLGTHIDCPSHLGVKKIFTDNIDLNKCFGKGIIIDVRNSIENFAILDTLPFDYNRYDYLLFYTGHSKLWGSENYFNSHPYLSKELAEKLANASIKGIGIDTANIDKVNDLTFPNHQKLLKNEKVIIENLTNLNLLIDKEFTLIAFPLKIENGDGSPVRAVALDI